jgi:hypothetical protein
MKRELMKKLLMIVSVSVMLYFNGCANKTTIYTRYDGPVYVSAEKYKKTSCHELQHEPTIPNISDACPMLFERYLFILPTEYEKLSCKQLHEQFVKVNKRYEEEKFGATYMPLIYPVVSVLSLGAVPLNDLRFGPKPPSHLDPKHLSEDITAKEAYETLKEVATKKNCSFVVEMK